MSDKSGSFLPKTWVDISIDNLEHNFRTIKSCVKEGVKIMSVVKADAYGHGVNFVAEVFERLGTDWFAVSNIEEALQLRALSISKPILILGYTPPFMAKTLSDNCISQTVFDFEYGKMLSQCAEADGVTVKIHIKIDTGMSRLGFYHHNKTDTDCIDSIEKVCALTNLYSEGIFTHFCSSDLDGDESGSFTRHQFEMFTDCCNILRQDGIAFELRHCCNSAATLNNPEMQLDMVRPGIILYGLSPSSAFSGKFDLKPAMNLKSVAAMVKYVDSGDTVSYGRTFKCSGKTKVATIPIGYADGYPRCLSNRGHIMINGKIAPVIGRVCMDQMMVDVSDINDITEGQDVLLFGEDKNGSLSIDDYSALCGTINYETICVIGKRVPRLYYKNGIMTGSHNYIYSY